MSNIDFTGRVKKSFLDNGHFSKWKKKVARRFWVLICRKHIPVMLGEGGAGCVHGCCHHRNGAG